MRRVITRIRGRAVRYMSSVTLEHSVIEYYISHVRGSAPYSTPQWSQLRSITNDVAEPRPSTEAVEVSRARDVLIKFPRADFREPRVAAGDVCAHANECSKRK